MHDLFLLYVGFLRNLCGLVVFIVCKMVKTILFKGIVGLVIINMMMDLFPSTLKLLYCTV